MDRAKKLEKKMKRNIDYIGFFLVLRFSPVNNAVSDFRSRIHRINKPIQSLAFKILIDLIYRSYISGTK
jgi:hypothetical protein